MAHGKFRIKLGRKASLLSIPLLLSLAACDGELGELPKIDPAPSEEVSQPAEQPPGNAPAPNNSTSTPASEAQPKTPSQQESGKVKIYWLTEQETDLGLKPSNYEVSSSDLSDQEKLTQTVERLLKGPANANVSSAIPEGTKLNRLSIKNDGVHVDLTKTFTEGGGSQSMQGRIGQIIYTASSLNSKMPVWISVEGEALEVLGGEGLEISQPMTRKDFDKNFSI